MVLVALAGCDRRAIFAATELELEAIRIPMMDCRTKDADRERPNAC